MKLKEIIPEITKRAKTNNDKARKFAAKMKLKARKNNPSVDQDSRNPSASLALQARSMNSNTNY